MHLHKHELSVSVAWLVGVGIGANAVLLSPSPETICLAVLGKNEKISHSMPHASNTISDSVSSVS